MESKTAITIKVSIHAPIEKVWTCWTTPEHIVKWNQASDDWHTTRADNDLQIGGSFLSRMEAKDGSMGFDFEGVYIGLKQFEEIEYVLSDERRVKIVFESVDNITHIIETFEAESENPIDMQRMGWQAILDNFKTYVESV